jgi:hypothetical protein
VRLIILTVVLGLLVASGSLVGKARAGSHGNTAAEDQYTPPKVVKPAKPAKPTKPAKGQTFTPPSAQASAPAPTQQTGTTLPFTGLSLWKVVLVGVALLVLGVLLRRGVPRRGP